MRKEFSQYELINNVGNGNLRLKSSSVEETVNHFRTKPDETLDVFIIAEPGGRSKGAAQVGLAEMPIYMRNIHFEDPLKQPSFPGKTTTDALPDLEKKYDRILFSFFSQSGTKATVVKEANRLDKYFEGNGKSDNVELLFITGDPSSETGKTIKKHGGTILELKGIESNMDPDNYHEVGFLGDLYELKLSSFLQTTTELVCNNSENKEFSETVENNFYDIGRKLDQKSSSVFFDNLSKGMAIQSDAFFGGVAGGGLLVSETARIRWGHLKRKYLKSNSFVMGGDHNPPPPLPGNLCLWTSFSGGKEKAYRGATKEDTSYLVDLCEMAMQRGTDNYSILGTPYSPLQKITPKGNTLLLKEKVKPGKPVRFYSDALLAHAVGVIKSVDRLKELKVIDKYKADEFKQEHQVG